MGKHEGAWWERSPARDQKIPNWRVQRRLRKEAAARTRTSWDAADLYRKITYGAYGDPTTPRWALTADFIAMSERHESGSAFLPWGRRARIQRALDKLVADGHLSVTLRPSNTHPGRSFWVYVLARKEPPR